MIISVAVGGVEYHYHLCNVKHIGVWWSCENALKGQVQFKQVLFFFGVKYPLLTWGSGLTKHFFCAAFTKIDYF